jgi:acetyl-CoA C-acetyltransferase
VQGAWIVDAVRTPRGKGRADGALHDVHPQELLAQCLRALPQRIGFDPAEVEDVVAGNGIFWGDHGDCIGRLATLLAGWPDTVPGMTLNRFCGSAQQAVTVAAMGVASGAQDLVVAGGVESMSRWDLTAGSVTIDGANPAFRERFPTVPQGVSADLIATLEGFSRAEVDALAAASQDRAAVAIAEGRFDRSIVPVVGPDGATLLDRDEHPRPGTTAERLASLRPAFAEAGTSYPAGGSRTYDELCTDRYPTVERIEHVHHAGNSSGVVDGAAAVLVASDAWVRANGVTPRAQIRAAAAVGSEPVIMLTAPGPAAQRCLAKAGMAVGDVDLWEVNEAFACVAMFAMKDLGIPHDKINIRGGATALGHPIGASGTRILVTLVNALKQTGGKRGVASLCIGGGEATAVAVELV